MYTDRQYIKGIQTGDREIFTTLVKQYLDPMVRFALRITNSDDIAHDIVQDVFMSVWAKGKDWMPRSSVAAYLFTAVRNRSVNYVTIERNRQKIESKILGEADLSVYEDEADPLLLSHLDASLELLTDRQQQAIYLRYYQGLTVQEVAEILGIDLRATRRLLSRSISVLHSSLSSLHDS